MNASVRSVWRSVSSSTATAQLANFLDRLGEFSEVRKRYPDISFGKTYVNITLRPDEDADDAKLTDSDHAFAAAIDGLID